MSYNGKSIGNISNNNIITNIIGSDFHLKNNNLNGYLYINNHLYINNNNDGPPGVANDIPDDGVW